MVYDLFVKRKWVTTKQAHSERQQLWSFSVYQPERRALVFMVVVFLLFAMTVPWISPSPPVPGWFLEHRRGIFQYKAADEEWVLTSKNGNPIGFNLIVASQ